jgi:hypothetical protein
MLLEPGSVTVPEAPCSAGRSRKAVENMVVNVKVRSWFRCSASS